MEQRMETCNENEKIAQLKKILESRGYQGDVHINGIEQGSVEQVIKSCLELRKQSDRHEFKDYIVLSHFSYNKDQTSYLLAKFAIKLDHPDHYQVRRATYEGFDIEHNELGRKVKVLSSALDIPLIEKARQWVTPQEQLKNKGKRPKI